ncbi:type II secretion system protein GspL [Pseudomonas sp. LRF_L74]|uniref:type II secretion system protein GspL n=1 Tax=Pseudomonas sp. LRF_L74 TaxID=3369422 RepID=UPI003F608D7D
MTGCCVFLSPQACSGVDPDLPVQRVAAGECQTLAFADALPTEHGWRLILPVEAVTVCAVTLPTTKARLLQKALPFAVEELLAEDVEAFHLAVGEALGDGRYRVYAVHRAWLEGWLALCDGNRPQRIEVDADLLAGEGSQVLCLDQRWLLGGDGDVRMALAPEDWPALRAYSPAPHSLHAVAGLVLDEQAGERHDIDHPLLWLAGLPPRGNLAQGTFARCDDSSGLERWYPVAAVLGVWLVLQLGFNLVQGWQLRKEAARYAASSEALYRELFPDDARLINLRAQFDQHLSEAQGSAGNRLLGLLDQAATAISAEGVQVRVEQLDFNAQRGDLAFNLHAGDFATLERLRTRLQDAGLAVDMGSASREDSGVSTRLVIGENG